MVRLSMRMRVCLVPLFGWGWGGGGTKEICKENTMIGMIKVYKGYVGVTGYGVTWGHECSDGGGIERSDGERRGMTLRRSH